MRKLENRFFGGFIYLLVIIISQVKKMFVISAQRAITVHIMKKKKISWKNMKLRIIKLHASLF